MEPGVRDRLRLGGYALLAMLAVAVLVCAGLLTPDPRGFGTHESLGLPACLLRRGWGMPCPGCGLTTGMAHAVRGELDLALVANPLSPLLAGWLAWLALGALRACGTTGRTPGALQISRSVLLTLALGALSSWLLRLWAA